MEVTVIIEMALSKPSVAKGISILKDTLSAENHRYDRINFSIDRLQLTEAGKSGSLLLPFER
jgi:hypothetical protein